MKTSISFKTYPYEIWIKNKGGLLSLDIDYRHILRYYTYGYRYRNSFLYHMESDRGDIEEIKKVIDHFKLYEY